MPKANKREKVAFIAAIQTDLANYKASIRINSPAAAAAAAVSTTDENQRSNGVGSSSYGMYAQRQSKDTGNLSKDEKNEKSSIFRRMFK